MPARSDDVTSTVRGKTAAKGREKSKAAKAGKRVAKPLRFDAFARSYVETAVWADRPEDCNAWDVSPLCLPNMLEDCERFQRENDDLLRAAYDMPGDHPGYCGDYDSTDAGHDFWLSRQGHAIGFDHRRLGEVGEKLDRAAEAYGSQDVLPDDDDEWLIIE